MRDPAVSLFTTTRRCTTLRSSCRRIRRPMSIFVTGNGAQVCALSAQKVA
jgi:hypothetical protein